MTEEAEPEAVTLEDLLEDAATVLEEDARLKGLARAVRIARAERGALPKGETWVRDIMGVIDCAEQAIAAAHENPDAVDLMPLATALEAVHNWGLTPEHRIGNCLRHVFVTIENLHAATAERFGSEHEARFTVEALAELLRDLGLDPG